MEETVQQFLDALADEPENLQTRLIFADWLEEQGEPWATFIRLQIERAQTIASPSITDDPAGLETKLFHKHHRFWNGYFHRRLNHTPFSNLVGRRQPIRRWQYARGFPEKLSLHASAFLSPHAPSILRLGPIQSVNLYHVTANQFAPILQSPHLGQLKYLGIRCLFQISENNIEYLQSALTEQPNLVIQFYDIQWGFHLRSVLEMARDPRYQRQLRLF